MAFDLLPGLWLHEPDAPTIAAARQVEPLAAALEAAPSRPTDLAQAYIELFLLNVYPYGTVFTDPSGEMNGPAASWAARRYEARGFAPPDLSEVGAPDHVGLCLGFLGALKERGESDPEFSSWLLRWAPPCCLAVERDAAAHPFYKALAAMTRSGLLEDIPKNTPPAPDFLGEDPQTARQEEEVHLSDVVRYLLAPARSGFFLSRSKLGQIAKSSRLLLHFGSRFDVARTLFAAAGHGGQVGAVIESLAAEAAAWKDAYEAWAAAQPSWSPYASRWLELVRETHIRLKQMREILDAPLKLELGEESGPEPRF